MWNGTEPHEQLGPGLGGERRYLQAASDGALNVVGVRRRIDDRGVGDGALRERLAVHHVIPQGLSGGGADVNARNVKRCLEPGRLVSRPRLAGLIRAETNTDDRVGLDARGREGIEPAEDALVVATEDDPVGDLG